MEALDCLIVGAGISGLLAATRLQAAGRRVLVLDKGRGLGGRMATRRRGAAVFDHGAQFFTARDARFREWVDEWQRLGIVKSWYSLGASGEHYCGVPGMTAIAKHLASPLDVRREQLVESVAYDGHLWAARLAGGETCSAQSLLLTAPVPQSLALLDAGGFALDQNARLRLERIRFHRCIAALAILPTPSELSRNGGCVKLSEGPVQWIADNFRKGISTEVPSVTIHSTPEFADSHWESSDAGRLPPLLAAAAPFLKVDPISCEVHRWGFSQPVGTFDGEAYFDDRSGLAIAGDGLAGGRVEGAALSGLRAAEKLLTPARNV